MKKLFILFLSVLISIQIDATILTPGETQDVYYNASSGEHSPSWTSDNPTLQVSYSGFNCHVTATAYFSGTAILTCKYKAKIGNSEYDRSKSWSFTCIDNQISINPSVLNLNIGESKQLNITFKYPTAITPKFYFTGYDYSLLSISNNGMLTAKKVGHTTLYVTSNLGSNVIPVDIYVNNNSGIDVGETLYFIYDGRDMTAKVTRLVNENVKQITIPEKTYLFDDKYVNGEYRVIGLSYDAFKDSKLESIEIPPFINEIGIQVFFNCLYLKEVTLPPNLTEIPRSMFYGCKSLERITLPENITIIDFQAFKESGLKGIQLPNKVKRISQMAFGSCHSLREIEISESVEVISESAFSNCENLKTIYFKGKDTKISAGSFMWCENINTIICLSSNPPSLNKNAFPNKVYNNAILYVPEESIERYEQDENWGKFKNIESYSPKSYVLSLNYEYVNLSLEETVQLEATILPADYNDKKVTWQSSDNYVATVTNDGLVKAVSEGNAVIRVSYEDAYAECLINVTSDAGIQSINNKSNSELFVYSKDGTLIMKNCEIENLKYLPTGIYIIVCGKQRFKIAI